MTTPRVSVVMAVHNGAPWIGEAIESVLAQTFGDLEAVIVDDGSTDATPDLLAAVRDRRLRVERRPHAGLTRSLNAALARAQTPLVARLDADDLMLPDRLERQVAKLEQREAELHARLAAVASDYAQVTALDAELRTVREERAAAEDAWLALAERIS